MTAVFVLKVFVLLAFVGYLGYAAVCARPRFLSWPMFTMITFSRFQLSDGDDGGPIDHWRHLVTFDSYHDIGTVDEFLGYLRGVHGIYAEGVVTYVDTDGVHRLEVSDGELDL
ncbi:hypothetical protein [Lentzea flaviverrucosa]|uniref:Uncharacterized protein n=2 Tax=Lentzea flaviverrucosa TaxID=200379 RepID=A0A1H9WU64_9PSEU|nr:hypothetical protein [Lentzea flaviverrucosa]RDI23111.1 hypothetical protein DFR72_111242 [Lentzea flaviverrucosa]SES37478.1 hypothetical protein SAMN05216195_112236 [Lentzea flaviverrucosa]